MSFINFNYQESGPEQENTLSVESSGENPFFQIYDRIPTIITILSNEELVRDKLRAIYRITKLSDIEYKHGLEYANTKFLYSIFPGLISKSVHTFIEKKFNDINKDKNLFFSFKQSVKTPIYSDKTTIVNLSNGLMFLQNTYVHYCKNSDGVSNEMYRIRKAIMFIQGIGGQVSLKNDIKLGLEMNWALISPIGPATSFFLMFKDITYLNKLQNFYFDLGISIKYDFIKYSLGFSRMSLKSRQVGAKRSSCHYVNQSLSMNVPKIHKLLKKLWSKLVK